MILAGKELQWPIALTAAGIVLIGVSVAVSVTVNTPWHFSFRAGGNLLEFDWSSTHEDSPLLVIDTRLDKLGPKINWLPVILYHDISIPMWTLLPAFWMPLAVRVVIRKRRIRNGMCWNCGYLLRTSGVKQMPCSECGKS